MRTRLGAHPALVGRGLGWFALIVVLLLGLSLVHRSTCLR
jgi:hypothetical protein